MRAIHTVYMLLRDADTNEAANAVQGIAHGTYKSPHLKLVKPSKNALKALSTAGYDMFLEIHDTVPAAVHCSFRVMTTLWLRGIGWSVGGMESQVARPMITP